MRLIKFSIPLLAITAILFADLVMVNDSRAATNLSPAETSSKNISLEAPFAGGTAGEITWQDIDVAESHNVSSFLQGCPKVAYYNNVSYIVYADTSYNVYLKTYNHNTQVLSEPFTVKRIGAEVPNDHVYPCIIADDQGYLNVFFGSRPNPVKYLKSVLPEDPAAWSAPEYIGTSGTYPIPNLGNNQKMVMYREGNAGTGASLNLAYFQNGNWQYKRIVEYSDIFNPMPIDTFDKNGRSCFLFAFRDDNMTSLINPGFYLYSMRDSISAVCTADGQNYTNLAGNNLNLPLSYENNYYNIPRVINGPTLFETTDNSQTNNVINFDEASIDGTVLEFSVTKSNFEESKIKITKGNDIVSEIMFKPNGQLFFSNGVNDTNFGNYTLNTPSRIRLKYYFSRQAYRVTVNGKINQNILSFYTIHGISLEPLNNYEISAETTVTFTLTVASRSNYPLTFSINNLPAGARLFHYAGADINSDGILNLSDLAILGLAYNSVKGTGRYNAKCDFNKDNAVNILDLNIFKPFYMIGNGRPITANPYYKKAYFEWKPTESQVGKHDFTFSATTGLYTDSTSNNIVVKRVITDPVPPNAPPITSDGTNIYFEDTAAAEKPNIINPVIAANSITGLNQITFEGGTAEYTFKVIRDYIPITAAACLDPLGEVNLFFEDQKNSPPGGTGSLMHYRAGQVQEIGEPGFHKYHPTCATDGSALYVASEYYNEVPNSHIHTNADLHILKTSDFQNWEDIITIGSADGQIMPTFSKNDGSGVNRLAWVDLSGSQPIFKYRFFSSTPSVAYSCLETEKTLSTE